MTKFPAIKCDYCGKVLPDSSGRSTENWLPSGWLELRIGSQVALRHFCSDAHLANHLLGKKEES